MSKIKNGGLDQYGAEPFEEQQSGTAGVEGVNTFSTGPNNFPNNVNYSTFLILLHYKIAFVTLSILVMNVVYICYILLLVHIH